MLNGKRALLITLQYIFTFSASQIHLIVSIWCWCKQFFLFFSFDVASHVVDVIFFLICWHVFCDVGFTSGYLWLWYLWDLMEICVFFVCGYFPFEIIKYRLNNFVYPENGFIFLFTYLLLIFPLRSEASLNALASLNECFTLGFFTWPMCEHTSQISAYQRYRCAGNLHSIYIVNYVWKHLKLKRNRTLKWNYKSVWWMNLKAHFTWR